MCSVNFRVISQAITLHLLLPTEEQFEEAKRLKQVIDELHRVRQQSVKLEIINTFASDLAE